MWQLSGRATKLICRAVSGRKSSFWFHCKPIRISSILSIFYFLSPFQYRELALRAEMWHGSLTHISIYTCFWLCSLAVPVLAGWVYAFCGCLTGTPEGSTSSGSGFKAYQKTGQRLSLIRQTGRSRESNLRPLVYKT